MEQLKRTARGLDTVCRVLFWFLIVVMACTVPLLIFIVVMLEKAPSLVADGAVTGSISVGSGVIFRLPMEDAGIFNAVPFFIMSAVIAILVCGVVVYGLKLIRSMLIPMKDGKPFDSMVSSGFRRLGWLTIGTGIAANLFDLIGKTAAVKMLTHAEMPYGVAVQHNISLSFLFIAALLFLLSYVFRYGEELQQLSDETL